MYNVNEFEKIVKSRLSAERYLHSMNVAESAKDLAGKYGANTEKAYICGVLHDITKEEELDIQERYINLAGESLSDEEKHTPKIYHQVSGAAYCRLELGITDPEILSAIRYHTTGRANMSLMEKIVYTADLISAERDYPDVGVMRKKAYEDLNQAMLYALEFTIKKLIGGNSFIHPDTVNCYNSILSEIKGGTE